MFQSNVCVFILLIGYIWPIVPFGTTFFSLSNIAWMHNWQGVFTSSALSVDDVDDEFTLNRLVGLFPICLFVSLFFFFCFIKNKCIQPMCGIEIWRGLRGVTWLGWYGCAPIISLIRYGMRFFELGYFQFINYLSKLFGLI